MVGADESLDAQALDLSDGSYLIDVELEGGSGRATITSPAELLVTDGRGVVRVEWSSPNFDYMKLGDEVYDTVNTEGNSVFELPIPGLAESFEVIADTTAMSVPHEITYTLILDGASIKSVRQEKKMNSVFLIAGCVVLLGMVIVSYIRKRT